MDYKDYIKEEFCNIYVEERENLADRLIEANYNLLFLQMVYERSESFRKTHDVTERMEIRFILRRIHITTAWELALQIKAFTDDNDKDTLTVNKFKNSMFKYVKDEKRQELFDQIGCVTKGSDWIDCCEMVSRISDYRNKVVSHNIFNPPELTFDVNEAAFVISMYEKLFNILNFQDCKYRERREDLDNGMVEFINEYLNAVLPL